MVTEDGRAGFRRKGMTQTPDEEKTERVVYCINKSRGYNTIRSRGREGHRCWDSFSDVDIRREKYIEFYYRIYSLFISVRCCTCHFKPTENLH